VLGLVWDDCQFNRQSVPDTFSMCFLEIR
jgi:hypothetical protein